MDGARVRPCVYFEPHQGQVKSGIKVITSLLLRLRVQITSEKSAWFLPGERIVQLIQGNRLNIKNKNCNAKIKERLESVSP